MTPELLRTQLLTLLPSQIDDLIRDQLSPEEAAHVPTRPASPAERAGAIITLAGQNASLRQRLEAALQSSSGTATPATPSPHNKSAEAVREVPGEDVLFSWIHLSDLHFGYGDAERRWDQRLVLGELHDDVAKMIADTCPRPEAIFVTGDIGFSGATKSLDEYADAKTWLLSLAKVAGLKSENVFTVPGNHDVQRSADTSDRSIGRLVRALRSGADALDDALGHKADAALLGRRQANYLAFAKDLAPASLPGAATPEGGLFWHHDRSTGGVLKIRVAGLNTALLAMDDEDRGKLRLGSEQIARALQSAASAEPMVVLALSHHPFSGGWLFDEKNVSSRVCKHAHVHLCGHIHEADAMQVSTGGGTRFITVTAGASYGDTVKGGPPASHGYNLAALVRSSAGQLQLKIWPRRWSLRNNDFRTDIDNVQNGQSYSLQDIAGIKVERPVPPVPDVLPKKRETPVAQVTSPHPRNAEAVREDVFLSYASQDRARAELLAKALENEGWRVWWDRRIPPGKTYPEVIEEHFQQARCVVVLWSQHSIRSDWVQAEASEAKERKVLVPAVLEEGIKAPLEFRRLQNANLVGWQPGTAGHQGFDDLVGAVREHAGEPIPDDTDRETPHKPTAPQPGHPFVEKTTQMSFVWVPPGKFWMGSSKKRGEPNYDKEAYDDELPAREVTITNGFWIGKLPVTNAQFAVFLEATKARAPEYWRDSRFNAAEQPLVGVDWEESRKFSQWLTEQAKLGSALGFALPTEAEWEYAARGSDGRRYPWGNEPPTLERADYGQDFRSGKPVPVGTHPTGQSPWGVQDVAGGVWEWCLDGWQESYVTMKTDVVDPCHPSHSGALRVVRGGAWYSSRGLRCAYRRMSHPELRGQYRGFRVVCRGSRQHIDS